MQEPEYSPGRRDVPWLIVLGVLGVGIPQSLVFVGNHLAGAAYGPILVPTTPVYVGLLSAAAGMEPFNRYRVRAPKPANIPFQLVQPTAGSVICKCGLGAEVC